MLFDDESAMIDARVVAIEKATIDCNFLQTNRQMLIPRALLREEVKLGDQKLKLPLWFLKRNRIIPLG